MADVTEQPKKLNDKQAAFVSAYLGEARFNGTKAAKLAGYSERTASAQAFDLLRKPEIRARIESFLEQDALTAREVLAELTDIASAEWREFVEVLKWSKDGDPLLVKMDLSAKVKSLELLGKHHQLFTENVNITGLLQHDHRVRDFSSFSDDELNSLEALAMKATGRDPAEDGG